MTNLRKSFEDAATARGDTIHSAVVGWHWHDNDEAKWGNYRKKFPVEPWSVAAEKLDYEYDSGFGGADCHAVIAWGDRFVFFEYDGATGINCVPRNPESCAPSWANIEGDEG